MKIKAKLNLYSGEAYIIGFVYSVSKTRAICVLADSGEIIEQPLDWVTITDTDYLTQEWKRKRVNANVKNAYIMRYAE